MAAITCAALAASADFGVYPSDPTAGEDVAILIPQSAFKIGVRSVTSLDFTAEPGRLVATISGTNYPGSLKFPATSGWTANVARAVPAGHREIRWRREDGTLAEDFIGAINVAPPVGSVAPQFRGITGNWYNPQEGGWGVNLLEGESTQQLLALWLDYEGDAHPNSFASAPTWRVLSGGKWISPTTFRGVLYKPLEGTALDGPSQAAFMVPLGYMSLTFKGPDELEFVAVQANPASVDLPPSTKRATLRKAF